MKAQINSASDNTPLNLLSAACDDAGLDVDVLHDLLWLLTARDDLMALPVAAERILKLLNKVPLSWSESLKPLQIDSWKPVLNWICMNAVSLAEELGDVFLKRHNTSRRNPLLGSSSSDFPFFAILCEPLPTGSAGDKFLLISAHLLFGYVIALRENSSFEEYQVGPECWKLSPDSVSGAALAVRRLAEKKWQSLLFDLPLELEPKEFALALELLEPPNPLEATAKQREFLYRDRTAFFRFLQKAWGLLDWVERDGGGGGGIGGHKWVGGRFELDDVAIDRPVMGDLDDPFRDWGDLDVIRIRTGSKPVKKSKIQSDLSPDEGMEDEEEGVVLCQLDCQADKKDPGAVARVARAKARYMSKANQVFHWTYDCLTEGESVAVLKGLKATTGQLLTEISWSSAQLLEAEAVLFLAVMFWTGSSQDRAFSTETSDLNNAGEIADLCLLVCANYRPKLSSQGGETARACWRIKALRPEYATDLPGTPIQLRAQAEFLDLPLLADLLPLVFRMLGERHSTKERSRLFLSSKLDLVRRAKKLLTEICPGDRITVTKISSYLWSRVHRVTGDAALASCVTGEPHHLANVRIFYTSPWTKNLRDLYLQAMQPLVTRTQDGIEQAHRCFWLPEQSNGTIGARLCPTRDSVRNMFKRLCEDIESCRHASPDRANFVRYHNLLTLFVVQYFCYCTTCRAIKTPYLSLAEINENRGLASLSDKDDEYKHKTRLVWLVPQLIMQMRAYEEHLKALKIQLPRRANKAQKEPCFFLDINLTPFPVSPKTLEPLLQPYLNVCANTHRRFIRTELIEARCPVEVIDAFMGHWSEGEEPFGQYSSVSFAGYVEVLSQYLQPLLNDIGLIRPTIFSPLVP